MRTDKIKAKLVALEARLDATLFGAVRGPDGKFYVPEEEGGVAGPLAKKAAAAAVGGAAGYGIYRADKAIMGKYGQRRLLGTGAIAPGSPRSIGMRTVSDGASAGIGTLGRGEAYRAAGRDVAETVANKARQGWTVGSNVYRRGASEVGNTINPLKRLLRAGKAGLRVASGGRIRLATKQRLVELERNLDKALGANA
jgi:hypothetical protein